NSYLEVLEQVSIETPRTVARCIDEAKDFVLVGDQLAGEIVRINVVDGEQRLDVLIEGGLGCRDANGQVLEQCHAARQHENGAGRHRARLRLANFGEGQSRSGK